jgi:cytochrome c oxidase cbb3-type subunit 3
MRKIAALFLMLLMSFALQAQNVAMQTKSFWDDPINHPLLPLYLVMTFVFIVVVLVSFVAIYLVRVLALFNTLAEKERAEKLGMVYKPKASWWTRFSEQMNAAVPLEDEKSIEMDHSYDGIKELDNHLPPWWTYLFYATIVWSVVYIVVFHVMDTLPLSENEYQIEVAQAEEQARLLKSLRPQAEVDENKLVFSSDSVKLIEHGKSVFTANNCGSCHRNDGGGNSIGPNLTDQYWLHGGHIKSVFGTIKNGFVEKGMPAWGKALSPEEVRDVAYFVLSLQGTKPANAKAPQGDVYQQATIPQDTVKAQASIY